MAKAISKPLALAVAVGLTLGGSFGAGAPAFAQQDSASQSNEGLPPGVISDDLIDGAQQILPGAASIPAGDNFSLTLHKRLNAQSLRDATGEIDLQAGGAPLPGAKFKIERLEGDIRTQPGLRDLVSKANSYNTNASRTADNKPATVSGTVQNGETNEKGELVFSNLPAGAYYVEETGTPDGINEQGFVATKPFIVLVPMVNEAGNGWNSAVHVYPKNTAVSVTKTVTDAGKHSEIEGAEGRNGESSTVTYTLEGVVPGAPEGSELKELMIRDSFNSEELKLPENFTPKVERIPGGTGNAQTIDAASYTVNTNAELPTNTENRAEGANRAFSVTFADPSAAGLQAGDKVRITAEVTMLNAPDQNIENSVDETGFFRGPDVDQKFETPNEKVVTYVGNIRVIKEDENNPEVKLSGAEFGLADCKTPDNYIQKGVTGQNGELTFEGIHVSNWVNNEAPTDSVKYCLTELKAPEGYIKTSDKPYEITLLRESNEFVAQDGKTIRRVSLEVTNLPDSERPVLPSTGGMGILIVALLGLGIIAGGVYAARRNSANA
ncbi:SpaH/EbpB family LPXTG-anchored major pilin [Corynebacterium propinquum]|uniref:SpaH/EbpB family LPXTG-anchored major pilin n=1 Tax=Corynebacterium propinquum TaxID=43769 RepID=UPI0020BE8F59|nr:SpaH/EbpB family LPXTG-anchored major pilin [Corynebacterium propinquum]UQV59712.1 SpaH/EbpB family LPXTG-anchored major pilin [Corynebacterium propinquum]